ncbi:MAG TPA: hypothetical protein VGJ84_13315 [Polyangiaceae bacterium]
MRVLKQVGCALAFCLTCARCSGESFSASGSGATGSGGSPGSGGSGSSVAKGGSSSSGAPARGGSSGAVGVGGASGGSTGCVPIGTVTLRMRKSVDATSMTSYCVTGCENSWLTIMSGDGSVVTTVFPCGTVDCNTCQPSGCPGPTCANQILNATGLSFTWDGTGFGPGTCGGTACTKTRCLPTGTYTAKMCAPTAATVSAGGCTPSTVVNCTPLITFTFPQNGEVVGYLP